MDKAGCDLNQLDSSDLAAVNHTSIGAMGIMVMRRRRGRRWSKGCWDFLFLAIGSDWNHICKGYSSLIYVNPDHTED